MFRWFPCLKPAHSRAVPSTRVLAGGSQTWRHSSPLPTALRPCLPAVCPHRLLATQSPLLFRGSCQYRFLLCGEIVLETEHWFSVRSDRKKKENFLKPFLFCPQLPQLIAQRSCLLRARTKMRARRVSSEPQILYHFVPMWMKSCLKTFCMFHQFCIHLSVLQNIKILLTVNTTK